MIRMAADDNDTDENETRSLWLAKGGFCESEMTEGASASRHRVESGKARGARGTPRMRMQHHCNRTKCERLAYEVTCI